MRCRALGLLHLSPMNSFNKTDAASFPMQAMLATGFPFSHLIIIATFFVDQEIQSIFKTNCQPE